MIRITQDYIRKLRDNPLPDKLMTTLDLLLITPGVSNFDTEDDLERMTSLWFPKDFVEYISKKLDMDDIEFREGEFQYKVQMEGIRDRFREVGSLDKLEHVEDDGSLMVFKYFIRGEYEVFLAGVNRLAYHDDKKVSYDDEVPDDYRMKFESLIYIENRNNPLNQFIMRVDEIKRTDDDSWIEAKYYQNGLLIHGGKLKKEQGVKLDADHLKFLSHLNGVSDMIEGADYKSVPTYDDVLNMMCR